MKKMIVFASLAYLLSGCITKYGDTNFKWLEGRWERQSPTDTFTEVWERLENGEFEGMGSYTSGGKIVFSEKLALRRVEGDLFYVVTVSGENDEKPVSFKYQGGMNDVHVFENKQHDFPQRIMYRYKLNRHQDSLFAVVEGVQDGKPRKEEFRMGRVE